jgi:hypothetical protein
MGRRVFLGMSIALAVSLPAGALPQAAAESALTNAISSSATVNGASVLNHALNKASDRLAGRIQERTSKSPQDLVQPQGRKLERKSHIGGGSPPTSSAVPGTATASIVIKGAEVTCAQNNSPTPEGKPTTEATTANCPRKDTLIKPGLQGKYPSAIQLSFPK